MGEFAIGQGVSRFEDPRLVRGAGHYTDDVQLPGMAHGVVLRAAHAHAKINAIDTRAAKAAPGVLTIITAADWKAAGFGDLPSHAGLKRPGGGPMYKPRYTVLAEDRVRWVGDCVAFVVADTLAQAQDAAELIQVDYEELPAVVSTAEAAAPGSARVYEDCPDNISFMEPIGDKAACEAGFAKAARVVKHRFIVNRITAVTMEPRGTVARFDRGDNRYVVHGATQRPHGFRAELAQILKVHETEVHIITGDTGGSFGMKTPVFNEIPLACYAAKLTGRPVKWISTRTEAFLSDAQGRDNVTEAELALTKKAISSPCGSKPPLRSALTCKTTCQRFSSMPVRSPAPIGHLPFMSRQPASSPIPIRCGPIAAMDGRRLPLSWSAWSNWPREN